MNFYKAATKLLFFVFLFIINTGLKAQNEKITVSGMIKDQVNNEAIEFATISCFLLPDSTFSGGALSLQNGRFVIENLKPGEYLFEFSFVGFGTKTETKRIGRLSKHLDLGAFFLNLETQEIDELLVTETRDEVRGTLDRKIFNMDANLSQLGGTALQAIQNLPGVTIDREGKVLVRGSDKVAVLLDGKQTAMTGFGVQEGLDNIPASAIERIEIINNPSAKYDATGMAGIINIVMKKEKSSGWNGKYGLIAGVGAPIIKQQNKAGIRDQYQFTPKINPSISANYKKNNINVFGSADVLYHQRLMQNVFIERQYDDASIIDQQFLENRTQPIYNFKLGMDWELNKKNSLNVFGLFNYRAYVDLGDVPYIERAGAFQRRLWQYYEDEVNQTITASITHTYKFDQPGHTLQTNFNYAFRRKDEVFYFENFVFNSSDPGSIFLGTDTTALVADENIFDLNIDYSRPLASGRLELGTKQRSRVFPNLITFTPGMNSILDSGLAGTAEYQELLSAVYGNYIYEAKNFEIEAGLRLEYAKIDYLVDPNHAVYESSGFDYFEAFPNVRLSFKSGEKSNFSLFYNRRVDRPEEKNLRVFPTYADPEILRIGNPTLLPQFTQNVEFAFKHNTAKGYLYSSLYYRNMQNILTNIVTSLPGNDRLVAIDQNAGNGNAVGIEMVWTHRWSKVLRMDINSNLYLNTINAFQITNAYPNDLTLGLEEMQNYTGNLKANFNYKPKSNTEIQISGIYLAPDVLPQGRIGARYQIDVGYRRTLPDGKSEIFANISDIFATMHIRTELQGNDLMLISTDYFETQAMRVGYSRRF
jgi:outer membrane receptor protein involved in Fe transport